MVKIHVEHEGRRWIEWVQWDDYRQRLQELLDMGAGICLIERED
jgi:hypothetical protein